MRRKTMMSDCDLDLLDCLEHNELTGDLDVINKEVEE